MKNQTKEYSYMEFLAKGTAYAVNIIMGCIKFYHRYEIIEYGVKLLSG